MSSTYKHMSREDKKWFKDYFGKNQPNKLYDLLFIDQVILRSKPYAVCVDVKNRKAKQTGYGNKYKIIRHGT